MDDRQLSLLLPLLDRFSSSFQSLRLEDGRLLVLLNSSQQLLPLLQFLRDHSQWRFSSLLDLWCTDYPSRSLGRFQVSYLLLSYLLNVRLQIRVSAHSFLPSVSSLYPSANWLEREVWDLFGLFFQGHADLRRILSDYGFEGFPLRKDFPLGGFLEVRYDDQCKKVVLEPVEFSQDYRYFDFRSPWESEAAVVSLEKEPLHFV